MKYELYRLEIENNIKRNRMTIVQEKIAERNVKKKLKEFWQKRFSG